MTGFFFWTKLHDRWQPPGRRNDSSIKRDGEFCFTPRHSPSLTATFSFVRTFRFRKNVLPFSRTLWLCFELSTLLFSQNVRELCSMYIWQRLLGYLMIDRSTNTFVESEWITNNKPIIISWLSQFWSVSYINSSDKSYNQIY